MNKTLFSVIVPIFNEEKNLEPLVSRIKTAMDQTGKPWELLLINDGSNDGSDEVVRKLRKDYSEIRLIAFTRNFGQTAAWAAGIDHARGDLLITLDGDLQNDPADIPRMYALLQSEDADIVTGWRKNRKDPFLRSFASKIAHKIINSSMHTDIKDLGCSLRIFKKSSLDGSSLYGEMHRLLPVLLVSNGAKIIQTEVNHHPRLSGKSKYGFIRTFKVLLDLVTVKFLVNYQTKPMYMFGFTGFAFIILSFLAALWVVVRRLFFQGVWVSPMLFIMTSLFNVGIVFILMGLLAEIQVRTWFESSGKKIYQIKNTEEWK